jgi:hypothetical protein
MNSTLERCLDDLNRRIDPEEDRRNLAEWMSFWQGTAGDGIFYPPKRQASPPSFDWPKVKVNQAVADYDSMLLQQFGDISEELRAGTAGRLNIRCNYGTGIMPTLFGCELFMLDDDLDTLPTAKPLADRDRVRRLIDAGVPDLSAGLGRKVFECGERMVDTLAKYPNIGSHVAIYHPDLQGPIDIAEVVWGSDIFYAFYEDADLVRSLLDLVTETYAAFMRKWFRLVGRPGPYSTHWGMLQKGALALRNDSLMNLSSEMYVDFVQPLDQRLMDEFGGGIIHFCGRGCHFIEAMSSTRGLSAIAMSQPECNDMEPIYQHTIDKGIKLLDFRLKAAGGINRPTRGQVQVFE